MKNVNYKKLRDLVSAEAELMVGSYLNGEQERTRKELNDYKDSLNHLSLDELKELKYKLRNDLLKFDKDNEEN